jgi:hypothetical protein
MADTVTSADVIAAATAAGAALRPAIGRDWSVRAGPLEWNVEQTITHLIADPWRGLLAATGRPPL